MTSRQKKSYLETETHTTIVVLLHVYCSDNRGQLLSEEKVKQNLDENDYFEFVP